ncbi:flagellar hook protein FlgE [Desulfovibrio sp.]
MGFSAMYVGATGITSLSQKMSSIGNDLSNVDTVAYRGNDVFFQDLMSRYGTVGQVLSNDTGAAFQIGMGVAVADVRIDLTQGSFMDGDTNTDMSIDGKGMFRVVSPDSGSTYYTRAGNFRFNNAGYLMDPHGNVLQGRAIDRTTGTVGGGVSDIVLPWEDATIDGVPTRVITSPPSPTTRLNLQFALDKNETDHSTSSTDPFFALAGLWNGAADPPLAGSSYAMSSSINVYDAEGNAHPMTIYLDKVDVTPSDGKTYWEYIATVDPAADGRAGMTGTSGAGLLMMGTLTFNNFGQLVGQTAYTYEGAGDSAVLSNWSPAAFSADGFPTMNMTFLGTASGAAAGTGEQTIALNLGLGSATSSWTGLASNASAASVGTSAANLPNLASIAEQPNASTGYGDSLATLSSSQDGHATGYLLDVSVTSEGYLRARYTNGEEENLYQIPLYTFTNEYGLRREGSNLYTATQESGAVVEGTAGTGPRGNIQGKTLEKSNVDMAEKFVEMITTQRGFQANTKVVSTSDSLLNTAISMKR